MPIVQLGVRYEHPYFEEKVCINVGRIFVVAKVRLQLPGPTLVVGVFLKMFLISNVYLKFFLDSIYVNNMQIETPDKLWNESVWVCKLISK